MAAAPEAEFFGPAATRRGMYVIPGQLSHCICCCSDAGLPCPKQAESCFSSEGAEVVEACLAMEGS